MIEIKGLTKRFGSKPIIKDVSVQIKPNKITSFIDQMVQGNQRCFPW